MSPPSLLTFLNLGLGLNGDADADGFFSPTSSEKVARSSGWGKPADGGEARSDLLSLARPARVDRRVCVVLVPVPIRPRRRDGFMNGIAGVDASFGWMSGLPLRREAPGGRATVVTV